MLIIIALFAVQIWSFRWVSRDDRGIVGVLTACSFYYCVAGTLYAVYYADARYAGVQWPPDSIIFAGQILCFATLLLTLWIIRLPGIFRTSARPKPAGWQTDARAQQVDLNFAFWLMFLIGFVASLYVLKNGSFSSRAYDYYHPTDPYMLLAFGISDVLVPVTIYAIATRGYSRLTLAMILYFIFYSVLVGFRYKIALLALPILLDQILGTRPLKTKIVTLSLVGVGGFALFTVMTLYRSKFGMPDFSHVTGDFNTLVFGAFAEANVLFGLSSIIDNYANHFIMYPVAPWLDSIKELIPHFIMPNRTSGEYTNALTMGLISLAGTESNMAWPWIGEALIMSSYFALIWAPAALAGLYVFLKSKLRQYAVSPRYYTWGLGLLAAEIGYYHYSRGYMPQVVKGYIFLVGPYFFLCHQAYRSRAVALARRLEGVRFAGR
jgi:hypothetical protein